MKKHLYTLAALCLIGNAMATGIPVFDGAAATNFVMQWTQMLKDYQMLMQQYNQTVRIYDQAVTTYDSMTGSRGFGMLHHSQNLIRLMPESLQENFSRTFSDGFKALSSKGRAVYTGMNLEARCADWDGVALEGCRNEQAVAAEYIASLREIDSVTSQILNEVQGLMGEINRTTDLKGASELQAQIQAKMASLNAARAQASVQLAQMQSMQREAARREAERLHRSTFSSVSEAEIKELCR